MNRLNIEQLESLWNNGQFSGMSRRQFFKMLISNGAAVMLADCATAPPKQFGLPKPVAFDNLPRWRGFNLWEKSGISGNNLYLEWDFDVIAEWGFDFVRLPTDYRIWTDSPGVYRDQPLKEIDQAIEWARERGIHANLCLLNAPGYCVIPPKEPLDLWDDGRIGEEARRQFAAQWRMLAARYRGISSSELSFNLVNEPPDITVNQYLRAATAGVDAIRGEDPERLIIADGKRSGNDPVQELIPLKVAQSTRGYYPVRLSHYRASWILDSEIWPIPTWPIPVSINQFLYGDQNAMFKRPLILKGYLPEKTQLTIRINKVSHQSIFLVWADNALVFEKIFNPGPGNGEWKESILNPKWNTYQAVYDREYTAMIPSGTREIMIEVSKGSWLTFSEIRIKPYSGVPAKELVLNPGDTEWGVPQNTYMLDEHGNLSPLSGCYRHSNNTLRRELKPWIKLSAMGVGVHVGEWGAYRYTPHNVVLAWMEDCLNNWKQAGMGWALCDLRGGIGPLDSNRADVTYEDYKGHKLDRKMMELLKQG